MQWTTSSNGKWKIGIAPSRFGRVRGWLINTTSGCRYVWAKAGAKINYMRQPSIPHNIPKYIDDVLKNIATNEENKRK